MDRESPYICRRNNLNNHHMSTYGTYSNSIKFLLAYFLGLLTGLFLVYAVVKLSPDHVKYVFLDILDIEVTIQYE